MVRSMTGFVTHSIPISLGPTLHAHVHIIMKSLNARFFETTFRLPHQFAALETPCIKRLASKLRRGHLYITIHVDNPALFKGSLLPATNVLEGYLQAIDVIKQRYSIEGTLTVEGLLQLPDIFYQQDRVLDSVLHDQVLHACDALADQLVDVQKHEGTLLAHDINQRLTHMRNFITRIEQLFSQAIAAHKEKIAQFTQENSAGVDEQKQLIDAQRHSAAYTALDKMDIHEEIVRFSLHLDNINEQLQSSEIEKGKRLDFTLQELMREINTIAAKSSDATIGKLAIDIKVELEKVREQAQNIV